jgi:hypothetical protein
MHLSFLGRLGDAKKSSHAAARYATLNLIYVLQGRREKNYKTT